jgi:transposase
MTRHPKPDPKRKALEESGTANLHAEHVQDPAFAQGDFFDPRDLLQVKYEMLRRVRTEGHSVTDAVTRFGVSRPTFYKVQEDFDRAGLVGLLPGKRGPHGPHKITDEVMRSSRKHSLWRRLWTPRFWWNRSGNASGLPYIDAQWNVLWHVRKKNDDDRGCGQRLCGRRAGWPHAGRALRGIAPGSCGRWGIPRQCTWPCASNASGRGSVDEVCE